MRKYLPYICTALVISVLCLCACHGNENLETTDVPQSMIPEGTFSSQETVHYDFETIIQRSNCGIVGEYVEQIESDNYVELRFLVKEVLYGEVTDAQIHLFLHKSGDDLWLSTASDATEVPYTKGHQYILLLECLKSLFYEHDRYLVLGDLYLPLDAPEERNLYDETLTEYAHMDGDALKQHIVEYRNSLPQSEVGQIVSGGYTTSQDPEDILAVTDYIIQARIEYLLTEGMDTPVETYMCTPLEVLQGDELNLDDQGKIGIIVPQDTVELGEVYYFLVNHVDEHSILYQVSSMYSVREEWP